MWVGEYGPLHKKVQVRLSTDYVIQFWQAGIQTLSKVELYKPTMYYIS